MKTASTLILLLSMFAASRTTLEAGEDQPVMFVRGDANGSAAINISDAVFLLNFLFRGDVAPPCLDAGDANDDGRLDLSDAVYTLSFLFLGGQVPLEPFPDCGEDTTADALDCESFFPCEPSPCSECDLPFRCVPDGFGSRICTRDIDDCAELESLYDRLAFDYGRACDESGCHLLFGHCAIGIGGCYQAVSRELFQEDFDAIAARFTSLRCFGPVCDCAPPPKSVSCDGENCQFDLSE